MTSDARPLAALLFLFVISGPVATAQVAHFGAGGGAGASVFGWQPRMALSGGVDGLSLGPFDASMRAALARTSGSNNTFLELDSGARVALGGLASGWWVGTGAVRREGFMDAVERPRIETGGWRRFGNVVLTISAARRSARLTTLSRMTRQIVSWQESFDTIAGRWDSVRVERTVGDSGRISASDQWAESEAGIAWEGRRLSAAFAIGGRLPSQGVPRAGWASADVAFRLTEPLSLVLGAGNAAGSRFVLDAEHRYVSLGFRVAPRIRRDQPVEHPFTSGATVTSFTVGRDGRAYRLTVTAPRARSLELSGDFSGWKPLSLAACGGGCWTVVLPLTPGTHRLNVRVDGGSWVAPPGLTTMSDDYAGEVGVLVIERENPSR